MTPSASQASQLVVPPIVLLLLFLGCGDDQTINVILPSEDVVATISGRVVSHPSGAVLPGASVSVLGRPLSSTSDAAGTYSFDGLAQGTYQLRVTAPDHATSLVTVTVDASQADQKTVPVHISRDLYLIEDTASLEVTVFQGTNAGPAPGAILEIDEWEFPKGALGHSLDGAAAPRFVQTDADGAVVLTDLPASRFRATIAPYDVDGDGVADFRVNTRLVEMRPGVTARVSVVLSIDTGAVEVVHTNAPSGFSGILVDGVLFFVFSTRMETDPGSTVVSLFTNTFPVQEVSTTTVWVNDHRLEIHPSGLEDGQGYDLDIVARSAGGALFQRGWRFLFDGGGTGPADCSEVITDLAVSPWQPAIDFNTTSVLLEWSAVPCAGGYRIFARDDRNNDRGWALLKKDATDFEFGTISSAVTLPGSFDLYRSDGIQTPFAGIDVTFAVVPLRALNPDVDSGHATVTAADQVQPTLLFRSQSGSAVNSTASPEFLDFFVTFSEFLSPSTPPPSIEFRETGGDPGFVLSPGGGSWRWEDGRRAGRFAFSIPPGADASGDEYRVLASNLIDFTGNRTFSWTTTWAPIQRDGGLFDFEGSAQGWFVNGTGWEWGVPTAGPPAAFSGVRCWGTALSGEYEPGWDTHLVSPLVGVPINDPVLRFYRWYEIRSSSHRCRVSVIAGSIAVELAEFRFGDRNWRLEEFPLDSFAGQIIRIDFHFESPSSSFTAEGFYLDDVSVRSATP